MIFIGVDPGKAGGIAVIHDSDGLLGAWAMPDTDRDTYDLISEFARQDSHAAVEKVASRPGQGVVSVFSFGRAYGAVRMALTASGVPFEDVQPKAWQKALGLSGSYASKKARKAAHKDKAQSLFPTARVTLKTADALLIAEWLRRERSA